MDEEAQARKILAPYLETISTTPTLLSMLYDADMLPEQTVTVRGAISVAAVVVAYQAGLAEMDIHKPKMEYCYDRNDWESTFTWDDRDILFENMRPGDIMEVGTLRQGPTLWVVEYENSDGDRETHWFDNEADARALAEGQDNA